jgi:hypothetical protein
MTNAASKPANGQTSKSNGKQTFLLPAISLDRPTVAEYQKHECLTFKLRSTPGDTTSAEYQLTVPFFSSGTPEEVLLFARNLRKVIKGQNVTSGPNQYALARRLLQGDALSAFNNAPEEQTKTVANFGLCLQAVVRHIFPRSALSVQKHYMRRFMRKPRGMKIRDYVARVVEINHYLNEFPPFGETHKLAADEVLDLLEYGVPTPWQKTMVMHGFVPMDHTTAEFVEFCERIESTELKVPVKQGRPSQASSTKSGPTSQTSGVKSSAGGTNSKKRKTNKYCPLHDTEGHDMSECKVLLNQAKKMRSTWDLSKSTPGAFARKKVQFSDAKFNEELNTVVANAVKTALKANDKPTQATQVFMSQDASDDE